ncbi:MAG: hypothetical protein EOO40_12165, partial [Deltaproteobacteria bacterium]
MKALWSPVTDNVARFGQAVMDGIAEMGAIGLFFGQAVIAGFKRPFRVSLFLQQAEFVGFGSLFIILLTGVFTGAVFTLQTVNALERVGME